MRLSDEELFAPQTPLLSDEELTASSALLSDDELFAEPTTQEQPDRWSSAFGSFAQAAGRGISDIPKSVAIEHGEAQQYKLSAFDAIDRGEEPGGIQSPTIRQYKQATPEERQKLRTEAQAKVDAKQYPSYQFGQAIDQFIADKASTNPQYEQEFWSGKVPAGLGSMVSYVASGVAATLGARAGRLPVSPGLASAGAVTTQATKQSSVMGFDDALEKGASLEDAYKASNLNELMGYSEAIPIARILDRVDKGTGGQVKRAIVDAAKAGTEEAIQEASQTIYGNVVASDLVGYDPDRGVLQGSGEGAGVGFTTGALVQFLGTVIGGRRANLPKAPETATAKELDELQTAETISNISSAPTIDDAIASAESELSKQLNEQFPEVAELNLADQLSEPTTLERDFQQAKADLKNAPKPKRFSDQDLISFSEQAISDFQTQEAASAEQAALQARAQQDVAQFGQDEPPTATDSQLQQSAQPAVSDTLYKGVPETLTGQAAETQPALVSGEISEDRRTDPQRSDRGERKRLQMPDEYAEQIHREKVAKHQLTPEQAADFAPGIRKNKLDYYADDELIPTMERAQQLTEETGQESHVVYSDVFNLGGGNEFFAEQGGEPAFDEKFFIPMAKIVADNLKIKSKDADVVPIRAGGDELAYVISNASQEEIEQAMKASMADIAKLNKDLGLADIKHAKKPDSPERGVGLYYGVAKIEPGKKPGEILKVASRRVALDKLRRKDVRREQAETTGAVAPEGQAEGTGGRAFEAGSRVPETEQTATQRAGNNRNEGLDEQRSAVSDQGKNAAGNAAKGRQDKADRPAKSEDIQQNEDQASAADDLIADLEEGRPQAETPKQKPKGPPKKYSAKQAVDRGYISSVNQIDELNNLIKQAHQQGIEYAGERLEEFRETVQQETSREEKRQKPAETEVLSKPKQRTAKPAETKFDPANKDIKFSKTSSEPWYFSALKRSAKGLKQETGTAEQFLAQLKNQPGVKAEELEWTGLEEYLRAQGPKKVTKQEIVDFLEANGVQVETVVKIGAGNISDALSIYLDDIGADPQTASAWIAISERLELDAQGVQQEGDNREAARLFELSGEANSLAENLETPSGNEAGATKFSEWQLPGGENYREVLLTLPVINDGGSVRQLPDGSWTAITPNGSAVFGDTREQALKRAGHIDQTNNFKSSHFDEPNILAHIRLNDRTDADGNKVLFVEEIQSDWHQQGRRKGYGKQTSYQVMKDGFMIANQPTREEAQAIADKQGGEVVEVKGFVSGVPDAPFKGNAWAELAIKRVLRMAAESGSDAWRRVTKPESVREKLQHHLGSELASVAPLEVMDAAVLPTLKHDQIRRAVIEAIPVDVVNILSEHGFTAEDLASKPQVVGKALPAPSRAAVARGFSDALQLVGTRLGAALNRALSSETAGREVELLPAVRASDLNAREVVGLLAPSRVYHSADTGSAAGTGPTGSTAKPAKAGLNDRRKRREPSSTELAKLLNRHEGIISQRSLDEVKKYDPGYEKIAWTTGEIQAERYDLSKQVDSVEWAKYTDESVDIFFEKRGGTGREKAGRFKLDEIEGVVGKDLAEKIIKDFESGSVNGEYHGTDLKVGGEGMKGFYDKILPNLFKKVAGKLDKSAKVDETRVNIGATEADGEIIESIVGDGQAFTVEHRGDLREFETEQEADAYAKSLREGTALAHSIQITGTMRDGAMAGQPLFRKGYSSSTASQMGDKKALGMPIDRVRAIADEFLSGLTLDQDINVTVVDKQDDILGKRSSEKGRVKGAIHDNQLLLVAENMNGRSDAVRTMRHEILAHYGLNTIPDTKPVVLQKIKDARDTKAIGKIWDQVDRDYAETSEDVKAEEVFARIAEDPMSRLTKVWNEIVKLIQAALKKVRLIDDKVTVAELRSLVESIAEGIRRGRRATAGETKYSKAPSDEGVSDFGDSGNIGRMTGNNNEKDITVYHGSFEYDSPPSLDQYGTGEGGQGFGYGFHITTSKDTADNYASPSAEIEVDGKKYFGNNKEYPVILSLLENGYDAALEKELEGVRKYPDSKFAKERLQILKSMKDSKISDLRKPGKVHEFKIKKGDLNYYLDYHLPLNSQSEEVKNTLLEKGLGLGNKTGKDLYYEIAQDMGGEFDGDKEASEFLNSIGIKGIRYVDDIAGSKEFNLGDEDSYEKIRDRGLYNYTVFDPGSLVRKSETDDPSPPGPLNEGRGRFGQTKTKAFRDWFGRSVVTVDGKPGGDPMVVYRSNAVDSVLSGKPAIPESSMDGLRGNAELLSNLLKGETFRLQGLGGFDVPTQRVVLAGVRSFGFDDKILRSVIKLIPVNVMDILRRENLSAEEIFHNESVLKKLLSANSNGSVSTAVDIADALVRAVTGVTAEDSGSVGFLGGASEGLSATSADSGYLAVSRHDPMILEFKPAANRGTFDPSNPNILYSKERVKTDFSEANRRIREEDRTLWKNAKNYYRRQFVPGGLLPKDVFGEKIARDNEFAVVEFDVNHLVGSLENIVKSDYGKPFEQLTRQEKLTLQRALVGTIDPKIPDHTKTAIVAMRQYIDGLSSEYASILEQQVAELRSQESPEAEAKAGLLETIKSNIGTYAHRSYRAFDDPKWFKKVPDEVLAGAQEYLRDRYMEDGETREEAMRLAEVTAEEILKNGTAYDSMEAFVRESKLGAKDLSVLKKRQQIAPEIRALLGEYIDPRINFAKSATKMGRLIWNQRFLDRVRDIGVGTFLFEGKSRPPGATVQIAAEGSEVYAPLNGLWTFPEINQAFKDALGKENMAQWYRFIVQMNGIVKYGKTVLSPTTAARNWQSAMFFAMANGHFDMRHMSKSLSGLQEYFTNQGDGARLEYLRKLKKLGVVYDTPYAGEMMRLLEESKIDEMMSSKTAWPAKAFKSMNKFATKAYQYGDDFWKIIGFENEKRALMKYMTESEAEKEAAKRIRDTYPTYSMVGRAINWLRRFPLAGTFVSFPAEIIRTQSNILKYAYQDLKAGRTALGMRRVAGQAFVAGFAFAAQAITKAMVGVDDDEEEAIRLLAAPWERNSNLIFTGRDENGELQYIDLSFLDPYAYFKRPVNAMLRDQPWEDAAAQSFKEALEPFLGADIAALAIAETVANKRQGSGRPVYNEYGTPIEITGEIANHLRKTLQPGIVSNLERTWKAIEGERSSSGRAYDLGDEAFGWVGWRLRTLDPKTSLYYRTFEFSDAKSAAIQSLTSVVRNVNDVDDDEIKAAYRSAQRQYNEAYREMALIVSAVQTSGMTKRQIGSVLKSSNISDSDVFSLLEGKQPPLRLSKQSVVAAAKKANTIYDRETAEEITRRYRFVNDLAE